MASRRPQPLLVLAALASTALTAAGCTPAAHDPSTGSDISAASRPAPAPTGAHAAGAMAGRFDPLTISLDLRSTTVRPGGTLPSRATIENTSTTVVVDPGCVIGAGRYALVPVDQPDAELWLQPVVDCSGPHRMRPGHREEFDGPEFIARTKDGDALPPGEYLAVLDVVGLTQRLEYPVTVTP